MSAVDASELRYTITRSGVCGNCGIRVTASGIGAAEDPFDVGHRLGDVGSYQCLCGATFEAAIVGMTLRPFIAQRDDDDDSVEGEES